MAIVEKEKAIDVVRQMVADGQVSQEVAEKYFPELAESEDERIRKEILDYIIKGSESCYDVQQYGREKFEKWIAWLEKQTEQKLYVNDNTKEMFIKALECVEEQNNKGYKLTDCDKNSWWEDFKNYTSCTIAQNHAWSEEDEEHLNSIISDIKTDMGAYPRSQEVIDIYNDEISFLKSLKERVQPQPKQEWSEEDETHRDNTITLLEEYKNKGLDCASVCIDWLKSLRPQSTWKPSDEQIKVLDEVIRNPHLSTAEYNGLIALKEQLKALHRYEQDT